MVMHFCQDGIPKTQVYHAIQYAEAAETVNHKKGRNQNLPPLLLQGSMIHSSELM